VKRIASCRDPAELTTRYGARSMSVPYPAGQSRLCVQPTAYWPAYEIWRPESDIWLVVGSLTVIVRGVSRVRVHGSSTLPFGQPTCFFSSLKANFGHLYWTSSNSQWQNFGRIHGRDFKGAWREIFSSTSHTYSIRGARALNFFPKWLPRGTCFGKISAPRLCRCVDVCVCLCVWLHFTVLLFF